MHGSHILAEKLPEIDFGSFSFRGVWIMQVRRLGWHSQYHDIREFCPGGILHFGNNIEETIFPMELQQPIKCPSVMICDRDWKTFSTRAC